MVILMNCLPLYRDGEVDQLGDLNASLDDGIRQRQRYLGVTLVFPALIIQFCSVCLLPETDLCHKIRDSEEGPVYRGFHCGKRGVKRDNLRYG